MTVEDHAARPRSRWRDWDHGNAAFGSFQLLAGRDEGWKAVRGRSVMGVPTVRSSTRFI